MYCRVIIIMIPFGYLRYRADEANLKWDVFCYNPFAAGEDIGRGVVCGGCLNSNMLDCVKSLIPIAIVIGVFTTQPRYEIPIAKVEMEKSTQIEDIPVHG
jgi:hypothetical protein